MARTGPARAGVRPDTAAAAPPAAAPAASGPPAAAIEALRRYCAGDAAALGELFDLYGKRVHRYVWHLTDGAADAEDLVQETFLALVDGLHRLRDERALEVFLFRIARRKALRLRGRLRRLFSVEAVGEAEADAPSPEEAAIDRERLDDLRAAVERLTPEQREAIVLAKFDGLPYAEVGAITGRTENAVKALVFRAMRRLEAALADEAAEAARSGEGGA